VLAVVAALALPAIAVAGPAVDEYTLDLPDSKGKVESPERSPTARASSLPPAVVAALAHDRQGKALATIATASELGAPPPLGRRGLVNAAVAGDQPAAPAAILSALDDTATIGLILLVALAGGAFVLARARRETR
jgi:hypothetical protein